MRPRKRILLYGGSEHTQSILRVVLESKGCYRVETKMSSPPDVFLLIGFSNAEYSAFEAQRWQACRESNVVSVPANGFSPEAGGMAELLDRIYLATCRKRGPKARPVEMELAA